MCKQITSMHYYVHPTFNDIFKNVPQNDISELIENIPTHLILNLLSLSISSLMFHERNPERQGFLLGVWLNKVKPLARESMMKSIRDLGGANKILSVFNNIGLLKLTQEALKHSNNLKGEELSDKDQLNLFKAYLILNDKINSVLKERPDDKKEYLSLALPHHLPQSELLEAKDFHSAAIKSIMFFKYFESKIENENTLQLFLQNLKVDSWKTYFLTILRVLMSFSPENKISELKNLIKFDPIKNSGEIEFLSKFVLKLDIKLFSSITHSQYQDFKILRMYPLHHVGENVYLFLSLNFFYDKLFQNILFEFLDIEKKEGRKGEDFKSKVYSKIMESIFQDTLEYCFKKRTGVKKRGDEDVESLNGKIKKEEYSDFYIRIGNKIFLFEFKDRMMSAETKYSGDFDIIEKDILDKFVTGTGAIQLTKVIGTIRNGGFSFDKIKSKEIDKLEIFPIIVITDGAYDAIGVNYIVSKGFKGLLKKQNFNFTIHDIVILNLDYLLKFQEYLHDKNVILEDLIKLFNENKMGMHEYDDFSWFFKTQIIKLKLPSKIPKIFTKYTKEIFKKNS